MFIIGPNYIKEYVVDRKQQLSIDYVLLNVAVVGYYFNSCRLSFK